MQLGRINSILAALVAAACETGPDVGTQYDDMEGAISSYADLTSSISGPTLANASSSATYTVVTTNVGSVKAYSPRIDIVLPAGYTAASGPGCIWYATTRTVTCLFSNMNPGISRTGAYTVNFPASSGTLTQTAVASLNGFEDIQSNNRASVATTVIGADLALSVSGATALVGGEGVSYVTTVTNNGAIAATNVWITGSVPHGAYPTLYPGCVRASFPTRVRCNLGTVAPGATITRTLTYGFPYAAGTWPVTISALGQVAEPAPANANNVTTLNVTTSAVVPVPVTMSLPVPQPMQLTNCFGDPGNFGSMAACPAAWLQTGVITFLEDGTIDLGRADMTGSWIQPNGPESLEMEFVNLTTGAQTMWMEGFGTTSSCFEGLNWWPSGTENRGAFRLCAL